MAERQKNRDRKNKRPRNQRRSAKYSPLSPQQRQENQQALELKHQQRELVRRQQIKEEIRFNRLVYLTRADQATSLEKKANNFIEDNSRIIADAINEHLSHPGEITIVVFRPYVKLILAIFDDEILAVVPEINCTGGAVERVFPKKYGGIYRTDGYFIFNTSNGFISPSLLGFMQKVSDMTEAEIADNPFHIMKHEPSIFDFIAADVQGFILQKDMTPSPRVSLPLPPQSAL